MLVGAGASFIVILCGACFNKLIESKFSMTSVITSDATPQEDHPPSTTNKRPVLLTESITDFKFIGLSIRKSKKSQEIFPFNLRQASLHKRDE